MMLLPSSSSSSASSSSSPLFFPVFLLFLLLIADFPLASSAQVVVPDNASSPLRLKRDLQSGALLSRYGRAAVLSRYGKRSGGGEEFAINDETVGPWLLCQRTADGQFLRCRPFKMRR